jgi:hypothetical protein
MSTNLLESPTVRAFWTPKAACAVTLVLVFLSGAALGAIVMDLGVHSRQKPPDIATAAGRTLSFERLQRELNLTPAQSEQIQSILNDFWQYYRSVLGDSKSKVEQVLTEPQRVKFERMLLEPQKH